MNTSVFVLEAAKKGLQLIRSPW